MKHYIIKYLFMALAAMGWGNTAVAQTKINHKFVADKAEHDFGTILERCGKVTHTFTFTNRTGMPAVINSVSTDCGCTTADYTKTVIRPGGKARVRVTFNPRSRPGRFNKAVNIILNNGRHYVQCRVKGFVEGYLHPVTEDYPYAFGGGLYMSLKMLPFPSLPVGDTHSITLGIANDTDKPMMVELKKTPNNRLLVLPERIMLDARERKQIKVRYKYIKNYNYERHIDIKVRVNGREVSPLRVRFFAKNNYLHMK